MSLPVFSLFEDWIGDIFPLLIRVFTRFYIVIFYMYLFLELMLKNSL